jgi:hypothetical protein
VGDEFVKGVSANELLKIIEEVEALLVWDCAECVVRVDSFVVDN